MSSVGLDDTDDLFGDEFLDGINSAIQEAADIFGTVASGKAKGISPERLAKIWKISHEDAQRTNRGFPITLHPPPPPPPPQQQHISHHPTPIIIPQQPIY